MYLSKTSEHTIKQRYRGAPLVSEIHTIPQRIRGSAAVYGLLVDHSWEVVSTHSNDPLRGEEKGEWEERAGGGRNYSHPPEIACANSCSRMPGNERYLLRNASPSFIFVDWSLRISSKFWTMEPSKAEGQSTMVFVLCEVNARVVSKRTSESALLNRDTAPGSEGSLFI